MSREVREEIKQAIFLMVFAGVWLHLGYQIGRRDTLLWILEVLSQ